MPIIRLHEEKNEFVENYQRQFQFWRQQKLTHEQLVTLEDLEEKLPQLKEVNDKVLKPARQMAPYTIDKIVAMDPVELAMAHLSGKIKNPVPVSPKPVPRFLVITDQACEAEQRQLTFFFKEKGTDLEIKALLEAFFESLRKKYDDLQGWGAKRLIGFFKNFTEFEDISYVVGAVDFDPDKLKQELRRIKATSYMRLWCDRLDQEGFPLVEIVELAQDR